MKNALSTFHIAINGAYQQVAFAISYSHVKSIDEIELIDTNRNNNSNYGEKQKCDLGVGCQNKANIFRSYHCRYRYEASKLEKLK
jgi:hypothetical protein